VFVSARQEASSSGLIIPEQTRGGGRAIAGAVRGRAAVQGGLASTPRNYGRHAESAAARLVPDVMLGIGETADQVLVATVVAGAVRVLVRRACTSSRSLCTSLARSTAMPVRCRALVAGCRWPE
jgi:hypothetical protein